MRAMSPILFREKKQWNDKSSENMISLNIINLKYNEGSEDEGILISSFVTRSILCPPTFIWNIDMYTYIICIVEIV